MAAKQRLAVGLDLGDRSSRYCILNEAGEKASEGQLPTTNAGLAQAAVRTKNSHRESVFRRLVPRLGYTKAIWAVARRIGVVIWKVLHDGVEYIEQGALSTPGALKRRVQRLKKELRSLGYSDDLKPLSCVAARQ
jgi:hypothetical protein